jgi:hypothetical protein
MEKDEPLVTNEELQRLERDFTYVAPSGDQPRRYHEIRARARELATLVCGLAPSCRERALALTKIEEAVMWANAAIARSGAGADHDAVPPGIGSAVPKRGA